MKKTFLLILPILALLSLAACDGAQTPEESAVPAAVMATETPSPEVAVTEPPAPDFDLAYAKYAPETPVMTVDACEIDWEIYFGALSQRANFFWLYYGLRDYSLEMEEDGETEPAVAPPGKQCGFVAVCAGAGMDRLFRELGCDQVVTGGQTMNPSTQDLLNAVNRTPAEVVFILPNNKNIIMAAEQCVPISTEKRVIVVPTKTVPQGITAMLNLDTDASPEEILQTFTDVIGNVHTIQVTDAVRDSDIDGHKIKEGELLCLMDGAILESTSKTGAMTRQICKAIRKLEPEFVTVYFGERASEVQAKELTDAISDAVPGADVTMVDGGQPVYYFMISVE